MGAAVALLGRWHRARGHITKGNTSSNGRWHRSTCGSCGINNTASCDFSGHITKEREEKKQRGNGRCKWWLRRSVLSLLDYPLETKYPGGFYGRKVKFLV